MYKKCPCCQIHKVFSEFPKSGARSTGLGAYCKLCNRQKQRAYKAANLEKIKEVASERRKRPETQAKRREYKAAQRRAEGVPTRAESAHRASLQRAKFDAHVTAHKTHHVRLARARHRALNSDAHVRTWRRHQRRSTLVTRRDVRANLYATVKGWLRKRLRGAAPRFSWRKLFPYTPEDMARHIESQFLDGMGWHNRTDWHIDHIKPIASFDIQHWDSDGFDECFALENLRPMWARDNILKGATLWAHQGTAG